MAMEIETRRAALWQEWQVIQAQNLDALQKGAAEYFVCIRQALWDKLALDVFSLARLRQKDENVYTHLIYLMDTYRDVIHQFESHKDDPAPGLVAGLCDILSSRLRQFEDVAPSHGNPITKEKQTILEKALLDIATKTEAIKQRLSPNISGLDSLKNAVNDDIQTLYTTKLTETLSSINDLHTRKLASYYTDLLEREWEVLGLIIQIQVKAIEALWGTEYANTPMSKLREAYQQTGPVISGFRKSMQAKTAVDDQSQSIYFDINKVPTPLLDKTDNELFLSALALESNCIFDNIKNDHMEQAKSLTLYTEDEIAFFEEIISTFEASDFWLTNMPKTQIQQEKEIVSGIIETVRIKIESLKESIEQLKSNTGSVLADIESRLPQAPHDAAFGLYEAWCLALLDYDGMDDFFINVINEEPFFSYADKLSKELAATTAKLEKIILRFRKESFFYEISTYEEILYYSVSKLRESELSQVAAVVEILDETYIALETIIEEKGITVIRPEPHQPFVGKEHEVLTAEEQEGFLKGEIIKTMTSGYKEGDQVILRANVIAAR